MSDFLKIEVTGLTEKQQALGAFADQLDDATADGLVEGMLYITAAMRTYPPQRPTSYVRTGNYGQRVTTPYITNDGGYITGNIDSGADYSIYLRGTPDGNYGGAWMHVGWWEPLFSIIRNRLSTISARINSSIDALIARLGL